MRGLASAVALAWALSLGVVWAARQGHFESWRDPVAAALPGAVGMGAYLMAVCLIFRRRALHASGPFRPALLAAPLALALAAALGTPAVFLAVRPRSDLASNHPA